MEKQTAFRIIIIIYLSIAVISFINLILLEENTSIMNEIMKFTIKDCWWCD